MPTELAELSVYELEAEHSEELPEREALGSIINVTGFNNNNNSFNNSFNG